MIGPVNPLTTARLSLMKIIISVLFVVLPLIGFFLGMEYEIEGES